MVQFLKEALLFLTLWLPPPLSLCLFLQDLRMHRGRGRDNSAAEERAQREGIKINGYSAGGPQFCSSSRSDPGSHEPDAGQSESTFREKKQSLEMLLVVLS